ncbi:MAG: MFS transporter, partial [Chloroflexota bacterium]|nr:MFS transporter [Chloroflexota bacterium]
VVLGLAVLAVDPNGRPLIFKLTALLFLLFALPCFLWVRERPRSGTGALNRAAVRRAFGELRHTVVRARNYPDLRRFLVGRIFFADAANTMIATMGIYATKEIGFSDTQVQVVLLAGILGAVAGGLLWGRLADQIGPKATLNRVLLVWAVVMTATASIAYLDLPKALFWVVAPLAGVALGGTWAADRPFMLRLTPPRHLGQFYGLYAMAGRFAAIIGPLLWTAVVDWLGWGRPAAVLSLLVMIVVALVILRPVDDAVRAWDPEELAA